MLDVFSHHETHLITSATVKANISRLSHLTTEHQINEFCCGYAQQFFSVKKVLTIQQITVSGYFELNTFLLPLRIFLNIIHYSLS